MPKKIDFGFSIEYKHILENFILYLAISPYTLEKSNLLNKLNIEHLAVLEKEPRLLNVVKLLLKQELISTNIQDYNVSDVALF
jgi:hypothetical protein